MTTKLKNFLNIKDRLKKNMCDINSKKTIIFRYKKILSIKKRLYTFHSANNIVKIVLGSTYKNGILKSQNYSFRGFLKIDYALL